MSELWQDTAISLRAIARELNEERDRIVSNAVAAVVRQLLERPGRPVQITVSALGLECCQEDTFRATRVEAYGQVWDKALTAAWEDPRLNLRQLADRLETLPDLVKHQADRLGLRFPRLSNQGTRRVVAMNDPNIAADKRKQDKTQTYRHLWEAAVMGNPEATITWLDRITN